MALPLPRRQFLPSGIYFGIRRLSRTLGVNALIARTAYSRQRRERQALCNEFAKDRPSTTDILVGPYVSKMQVRSASQYADLKLPREPQVISILFSLLQSDDVVWDVGANVGYFTLPMSQHVGGSGRVIAFEPMPGIRSLLTENVAANRLSNVTILPVALGKAIAKTALPEGSSRLVGGHVIRTDVAAATEDSDRSIQITTGDTLCYEEGLPAPDLIKIDCEGAELDVLAGMTQLLNSSQCRAVLVEVHFRLLAERGIRKPELELRELLRERGFSRQRWIDRSHLLAEKIKD